MANTYMFHVARCNAVQATPLPYVAFVKLLNSMETK